jgi:hypothetical protein
MNVRKNNTMNKSSLERNLVETGYAALFLYGMGSKANSFWENGTYQKELEEIVYSETGAPQAKFLAAEILRRNGIDLYHTVAQVYAEALQHSSENTDEFWQINANEWVQLFDTFETGPLGEQLLSFGNDAIPHLHALLDNTDLILYDGSEEATLGNKVPFRVKDLAAYFISTLVNRPLNLPEDTPGRDKVIEQLKTSL